MSTEEKKSFKIRESNFFFPLNIKKNKKKTLSEAIMHNHLLYLNFTPLLLLKKYIYRFHTLLDVKEREMSISMTKQKKRRRKCKWREEGGSCYVLPFSHLSFIFL